MSTRQTAMINGLLAENLGKNDLVRHEETKSRLAESRANDAEIVARSLRSEAGELASTVRYLKKQLEHARGMQRKAETEAEQYKQEAEAFKGLLSQPMKEIAEVSGDFKLAYELQQQMLAEWILAQRAYKETATVYGIQLGKTAEEVLQAASQNANAVLENRTEHGNDASTNPTLTTYADAIIATRKKNGKM